jgi:peptidoglycan/LPS O-acetylase OafA/YrhL
VTAAESRVSVSGAPAPASAGTTTPSAAGEWAYRPYLDGLRAVAVYLVVAFHAGLMRWRGGFIGVDVFFVLSGYLVTNLLTRDLVGSGRIGFSRFYSRRVRRLLPAAVVNLAIVAIVFRAIAAPVDLAAGRASIRAAALYVSNWYFIREAADYFGTAITASPVAQYWSLSVEEQFYVVWPLLVFALFRIGRRARAASFTVARIAVVGGAIASAVAALHIATYDPNRAYYGTDTRAYQLLAGAFLALTPGLFEALRRRQRVSQLLPIASLAMLSALVAIGTSAVDVGPITRGCIVTLLTCGLIVALEAARGSVARDVLSLGPLAYLGRISYGTYLWHWIVILVATQQLSMAPFTTFAATVPLATGLAALSYELIEHPIRRSAALGRYRVPVIAAGLTLSLLVAVVVTPNVLERPSNNVTLVAASQQALDGTPNDAAWGHAFFDVPKVSGTACNPDRPERCIVVHGGGTKILVAGESHAAMLVPMVAKLARRDHAQLTFAPLPYCPWVRGIRYTGLGRNCPKDQDDLYDRLIPEVDPDVVILAHRTVDDPLNRLPIEEVHRRELTDPKTEVAALRAHVTATVHALRRQGRKVVLIEPVPVSRREDNPETCLSKAKFLEQCRFVSHTAQTPEERIFRDLAAADSGVVSVDFDHQLCPYLPICDPVVRGMVVRHDDTHITRTFALSLLDYFAHTLADHGVLKSRA